MKKIIVTGIILIIVTYFGVLNFVVYTNNEMTTIEKIVSIIEIKHGNIESIEIVDNTTDGSKLITEKHTINQFKDEVYGIVLTSVHGEKTEEIMYSFSFYTVGTATEPGQIIEGYISSNELRLGEDTYSGNGIKQVLDVIRHFHDA